MRERGVWVVIGLSCWGNGGDSGKALVVIDEVVLEVVVGPVG